MSEASPTSEENLSEEEKQPPKKRGKKIQKQKKKEETAKKIVAKDESNEETEEEEKPKKKVGRKAKKLDHPRTIDMVLEAIENLEDQGGSSVQAIKSYIVNNFKVRDDMLRSMLRRALTTAIKDNLIIRPKNQVNNTQLLSGRYLIRHKTPEELPAPKPRPSKLRQLSVLKKSGQKTPKSSKKKKKRRKGFY